VIGLFHIARLGLGGLVCDFASVQQIETTYPFSSTINCFLEKVVLIKSVTDLLVLINMYFPGL